MIQILEDYVQEHYEKMAMKYGNIGFGIIYE